MWRGLRCGGKLYAFVVHSGKNADLLTIGNTSVHGEHGTKSAQCVTARVSAQLYFEGTINRNVTNDPPRLY